MESLGNIAAAITKPNVHDNLFFTDAMLVVWFKSSTLHRESLSQAQLSFKFSGEKKTNFESQVFPLPPFLVL